MAQKSERPSVDGRRSAQNSGTFDYQDNTTTTSQTAQQLPDAVRDVAGFAQVPHAVTLDARISDGAFRLYSLLHLYAQQKAVCWPGLARLASDLQCGPATVKRRFTELERVRLVRRARRYGHSSLTWLLADAEQDQDQDGEPARAAQPAAPAPAPQLERTCEQLKNEPFDQLKNEPTEEQQEKNNNVVVESKRRKKKNEPEPLTDDQLDALDALMQLGFEPESAAEKYARRHEPASIRAWCRYADRRRLGAAYVRKRLDAGDAPPDAGDWQDHDQDHDRAGDGATAGELVGHWLERVAAPPDAMQVLWQQAHQTMCSQTTMATAATYFTGLTLVQLDIDSGTATVGHRDALKLDFVSGVLRPLVQRAIDGAAGRPVQLAFSVLE